MTTNHNTTPPTQVVIIHPPPDDYHGGNPLINRAQIIAILNALAVNTVVWSSQFSVDLMDEDSLAWLRGYVAGRHDAIVELAGACGCRIEDKRNG